VTKYRPGDVVLLVFPFSDARGVKRRPALVLLDVGDEDVVVTRITSHITRTPFDVELEGWQEAGLLVPSVVRIHKLATIEKHLAERKLGALNPREWAKVQASTKRLWSTL
jgi:mRNA interferase MazF